MKNLFDYHIKDSRELDKIIKEPIVDVIITSPPYWNLKDYDSEDQIGRGQKYNEYLEDLVGILEKCKNVLKETGSMWVVVDSFKQGGNIKLLPFELAEKLQKHGLFLHDIIIWQKDKTLPWSSKGKLRNIFEYVLFFTKSKGHFKYNVDRLREIELKRWWVKYPERYNPRGKVPSRVWEIPLLTQGWGKSLVRHFCPFPPRLVENILFLTTDEGDVVLDPFAGSGSVLAQSKVMNRKPIGFDLNSEYKEMYQKTVLPFFEELWVERKKELNDIDKKKKHLRETVPRLRKIKYSQSLYKELHKAHPNVAERIDLIIAHSRGVVVTYYFVYNGAADNLQNFISKMMENKKMKKFTLKPKIEILNISDIQGSDFAERMYIYENGVNNYYTSPINFNDWLTKRKEKLSGDIKEKIPPIISNVKVYKKDYSLDF